MILIDGKVEKLALPFITTLKEEIGEGRYLQCPKELLSKLKTRKEDVTVTVSPFMSVVKYEDTFYGVVLRNEKEEIIGFDFNKDRREAEYHKVIYCKTAEKQLDGTYKGFKPEYLQIGGNQRPNTAIIEQEDFEEYCFLSRHSRKIKGSMNEGANTVKDYQLEFIHPERDATNERVSGKFKRKAMVLIWEDEVDGGFTADQLYSIGRNIGLPVKQYRNLDQLRKAIESAAQNDETARVLSGDPKIKGWEYIIQLGEKKGPDYELRDLATRAIEKGVVSHDTSRKQFVYMTDGVPMGIICPVDDTAPMKINVLIAFIKHDVEARERIQKSLKNMEPKVDVATQSIPPAKTIEPETKVVEQKLEEETMELAEVVAESPATPVAKKRGRQPGTKIKKD